MLLMIVLLTLEFSTLTQSAFQVPARTISGNQLRNKCYPISSIKFDLPVAVRLSLKLGSIVHSVSL